MTKPKLFGKTLGELEVIVADLGRPSYTARQIAEWLYPHRAGEFDEMTNLPKALRAELAEAYDVGAEPPISVAVSVDGTKKYLFSAGEGAVETAWIPEEKRGTLCVSSQVGCRRGCRFCMTARQGLQGNLTAGEILNQYRSLPEFDEVTNFVFMGMGEPLDNLDAVTAALEILTAEWGYGFSPKKVTVSTIGILDGLERILPDSECRLALSLHSPFPDERVQLIPNERRDPLEKVLAAFRTADLSRRRLTVEYLMLDGRNDDPRNAKELARILEGLGARVNLIPFHPIPDFDGAPSPPERMEAFRDDLKRRGVTATIRRSRGLDIAAACGLLSTKRSGGT
jgi:23S rRNA (adenine2503-C2)-methyltransferase